MFCLPKPKRVFNDLFWRVTYMCGSSKGFFKNKSVTNPAKGQCFEKEPQSMDRIEIDPLDMLVRPADLNRDWWYWLRCQGPEGNGCTQWIRRCSVGGGAPWQVRCWNCGTDWRSSCLRCRGFYLWNPADYRYYRWALKRDWALKKGLSPEKGTSFGKKKFPKTKSLGKGQTTTDTSWCCEKRHWQPRGL